MTKQVYFRFDCPACGEPWASPTAETIDIHGGGAETTCEDCGAEVVFAVYLLAEEIEAVRREVVAVTPS